jgi:hypothetical protein
MHFIARFYTYLNLTSKLESVHVNYLRKIDKCKQKAFFVYKNE